MMNKVYSPNRSDYDRPFFDGFVNERFFANDDSLFQWNKGASSIDKPSEIDEMLMANITQMTHRVRQEH